ncbi:MAG TPA: lasso peptide biosynthesis B2 protein [Actinomycetota bacterium]|jgi:hypothetical protein|nr:lasso peptide biosynthesis B2 protein [Actinomycetota bacterium]
MTPGRIGLVRKAGVAARAWFWFLTVHLWLLRDDLPGVVARLGRVTGSRRSVPPVRLGRGVFKALRVGPVRPRCLSNALVFYRLLREQGERPELVIGLPVEARTTDAHAWVEIGGVDVGPPPGRGAHQELARFG